MEGVLDCKVTSNTVIVTKDGRPSSYSGFENGFEVGDTLSLKYVGHSVGFLGAELNDFLREQTIWRVSITSPEGKIAVADESFVSGDDAIDRLRIGPDAIFGTSILFGRLNLNRYYKSDWHGNLTNFMGNPPQVQVATLDCRTVTDSISEVAKVLRNIE